MPSLAEPQPRRRFDPSIVLAKKEAEASREGLRFQQPQRGLVTLALVLVLASAMTTGYLRTQREVTIIVNGSPLRLRTHQTSVAAVLEEAGIEVHEEDIVLPGLDAPIRAGDTITVHQARPVTIEADGRVIELRTHSRTPAAILREAGISLKPSDKITLNGQEVGLETQLHRINPSSLKRKPSPKNMGERINWKTAELRKQTERVFISPSHRGGGRSIGRVDDPPLRIAVRRAVPIYVDDDGTLLTIYTTAPTVGEALWDEGIILYLGDRVSPDLSAQVSTGTHIYIQRSKPVEISVDGRTIKTRTQGETVAQVLAQEGIALMGKDYTRPGGDVEVTDDMNIQVVRVKEEVVIEEEPIPFETVWRADSELELDRQRLDQAGEEGVRKRRIRVVYENGQEVQRTLEEEWVDREPTTEVIAYGTKIVIREMETPEGVIQYWRKMRVLATSYTAATAGKSRDHPYYGITRLGWKATKGIIAVDPRVINLRTKMYVPGYGIGIAGDTGGRIKGRRIDLCYDEDDLRLWYRWVDVYLLAPPPPPEEIRWILPSWPYKRR